MRLGIGLAISQPRNSIVPVNRISSPAVAYDAVGEEITISAVTNFDLSSGRFGAAVSVNGGAALWYDGVGAVAGAQSLVLSLAAIGAVAGDQIDVDPGYSLTDPAVDKVYCSASAVYPGAVIETPTITGGSNPPKSGETLTGANGTMVGPFGQVRSVLWLEDGAAEGDTDNSLLLDDNNIGMAISFRNASTFGAIIVNETSTATAAVVSGGVSLAGAIATSGAKNFDLSGTIDVVPTVTPSFAVVSITVNSGASIPSTAYYGVVPMTPLALYTNSDGLRKQLFYLASPPAGPQTITLTMSGTSSNWIAHAILFAGASAIRGAQVTGEGFNGLPSRSVSSAVGDLCFFAGLDYAPTGDVVTPGTDVTSIFDVALFGNARSFGLTKAGAAGSVTVNGTLPNGNTWAGILISVQP